MIDISKVEFNSCCFGHTEVIDRSIVPTCTAAGLTEGKHCSVCNEIIVAQVVVDALGHDEINNDAKAPTCTEIGWEAYVTCSRCDYTTYEELAAKGHTLVVIEPIAATCTNTGLTEGKKCSVCNEVIEQQEPIDPLGHSYSTMIIDNGCTEESVVIYICSCGDSYTDIQTAPGHDFDGSICKNCGYNSAEACSCNCHKKGFMSFIWRIINFFNKLFKNNKVCACGVEHY